MKYTVTIIHEVEAKGWDDAVMQVAREPLKYAAMCRVKVPGKRLLHVMPSQIRHALEIDAKLEPES